MHACGSIHVASCGVINCDRAQNNSESVCSWATMSSQPPPKSSDFQIHSYVWGYHAYRDVWQPRIGEVLTLQREPHNHVDKLAVAEWYYRRPCSLQSGTHLFKLLKEVLQRRNGRNHPQQSEPWRRLWPRGTVYLPSLWTESLHRESWKHACWRQGKDQDEIG